MMTSLSRGKWIPSPLQKTETSQSKSGDGVGRMKILADVIESILGVVYLEFGYHISMKVGNELKVTFPWDETDVSVACGEHGEIDNSLLLDVVKMCTGHNKAFNRPKLVDEAFTHPSAIDATVPSYQRLEWIGDAVLCLCAREWLFKNISGVTLGDLVLLEGALVSNETLAFVSMKYGLQHYLNHREKFLPKRIESYCWSVKEGCGLWGGGMYFQNIRSWFIFPPFFPSCLSIVQKFQYSNRYSCASLLKIRLSRLRILLKVY